MALKSKLDELRALLRGRGLRATPSRVAVLDLLQNIKQPISHAEVAARLAGQAYDPATLYRNLMDLAEVGLARRTDIGDHIWRFELVGGDHDAAKHPHFVCTECGTVECLPVMELSVPRAKTPKAVRQRKIEVQIRGLCDTCA
jgi:Fur family transcriptional regulator, ferric uptake regulator